MEDEVPVIVLKAQLFLPRKLRRRMNYFWAFKKPKNPDVEMKVRKMKRNILDRASVCTVDVYDHWTRFVEYKDILLPELKSLEGISDQIEAGIFTPAKLRNAIYSRMLEEAAYVQFEDAEDEAAAAQQFVEETVVPAHRIEQVAANEGAAAARFANKAAETAQLAKVAAESAQLAEQTKETVAVEFTRKATDPAQVAKKAVMAAQLAEDKASPEATPDAAVVKKLETLLL